VLFTSEKYIFFNISIINVIAPIEDNEEEVESLWEDGKGIC
jgi:hypothetical protein